MLFLPCVYIERFIYSIYIHRQKLMSTPGSLATFFFSFEKQLVLGSGFFFF